MRRDAVLGWQVGDAVVGWRAWNLTEDARGPLLLPSGSGTGAWPRRRPLEAACAVPALLRPNRRHHVVPDPDCRCGVYASRTLEAFARERPAWPPAPVIGRVSLWGRTVEHERGWRAASAYPSRLRLACVWCTWVEPGPGTPAVVHRFGAKRYTLCERHRGGIEVPDGRRSVPIATDPGELQARLLEAYAVDLLPEEPLQELFARPPAADVPAPWPAIRTVAPRD
jgi:hypothetical protein